MGLLKLPPFHSPGVNAWATEKPIKPRDCPQAKPIDMSLGVMVTKNGILYKTFSHDS